MLYILDRNEQVVGLLQSNSDRNKNIYYDDVLTEILSSGADTFTFTSIPDRDTSKKLTVGNYIAFKKGNKFKLLQIIEVNESKEDVLTKEIYCEGAGLELINTVYSGSKMDSVNIKRFLINILQDTNWNVGYVDSNLTKTLSLDVEEKEVYSIIQEYLYDFEAEIDFRVEIKGNRIVGRYIDVYSKRGRNNGRRLEINRDIKSISRKVSLVNYATKLIGEGKNGLNFRDISMSGEINKPLGQNFVVNEEAYSRINNKGKHITRKFTYDTEDAYELLRQTYKALKEYSEPKVTYEVDADILNFDDIEIGDYVSISDLSFTPPLLVTARISELETSKTNKYANKAVLSNFNEVRSGISSIFPILGEDIVSGSIGEDQMNPDYVDSIISDSVNASMVKTEILLADKANISDLNATNATVENLTADFAEIDELLAGNITAENIKADSITSDHIQANTIDTKHLKADIIDAEHINANSITSNHIQSNTIDARHINANSINSDHIQANTITSGHIQTGTITAGSGIIADGAIGDALIANVNAGKIKAGQLDTSLVTIQSNSGNMIMSDNTIQIKDKSGKARVQIGKDASSDYNMYVWDSEGQVMFDASGITDKGINRPIIRDDMISDTAHINGKKIDIESVITKINDSETLIKTSKLAFDDDGQSFNVAFKELKDTVDDVDKDFTNFKNTEFSVEQGRINSLIQDTTIEKDGETYKIKDMYSKLEQTTTGLSSTVSKKVDKTSIISTINQSAEAVTINASKINLTGLVTIESLKGNGTTTINGSNITTGTLDASKVTVTNLNASNIKSGKLSANYIDATNLSVKGELLSGQINGIGGMKFADGAVISSCESGVAGYKGIQISAPVIKLGDKVEINRPTIFYDVTGKNDSSSKTTTWTMSSSGGLNCSTINTTGTTTVGGTLNVRNNMINGMNNLQMGRGSVNIPIFGTNYTYDYIKGGRGTIAFADSGPIHFLYNGTRSSFVAGGTVYLPHAGNVNCDHFRLGSGIMACPSSGSFHFLTANGNTSPLYAGTLYSADVLALNEPMVMSNNSVFDKINSIDVIETKNGLRLHNPISNINAIDESPEVVKTVYNEEKDEIKTSIDYTSAISTLWKAVQELKQENNELKEIIKSLCPKE